MKKILSFNVNEERMPFIESWAKEHNVIVDCLPDYLTMENVDAVNGYDGITVAMVGQFDSNLYPELQKRGIKQVAQRTAGYENFDLEEASKYGIIISNVPTYSPESIAEYTLLLALQMVRKSHLLDEKVAQRDFRWLPDIRARVIQNMTVSIIGVGHIGVLVAKLFKGFGATVIGYDPYPKEGLEDILTYCDSVEEAVRQSDIVSLHMPAFDSNYHLFDKDMFEIMKDDAYLINCGRGTLVNTPDLIEAVNSGKIAGAALDVYEKEAPYVPGNFSSDDEIEDKVFLELLNNPNIIFYHHCAYYTDVSIKNMTQFALDAALSVIETGDTSYRVN